MSEVSGQDILLFGFGSVRLIVRLFVRFGSVRFCSVHLAGSVRLPGFVCFGMCGFQPVAKFLLAKVPSFALPRAPIPVARVVNDRSSIVVR
jgi:hypothetical protein